MVESISSCLTAVAVSIWVKASLFCCFSQIDIGGSYLIEGDFSVIAEGDNSIFKRAGIVYFCNIQFMELYSY